MANVLSLASTVLLNLSVIVPCRNNAVEESCRPRLIFFSDLRQCCIQVQFISNEYNSFTVLFLQALLYQFELSIALHVFKWSNQPFFQPVMGMILKVWNAASAAIDGKMVLTASSSAAIRD